MTESNTVQEQEFVMAPDGTEVLKSKGSRAKLRRWGFNAHVRVKPGTPVVILKMDTMSYTTAKQVKKECGIQADMLRQSKAFTNADIRVEAIPHETVSHATVDQINGFRDMASILDSALSIAIEDAQAVVSGRSVGSQFVELEASLGDERNTAKPARTMAVIKEEFYKRAVDKLKQQVQNT